MRLDSRDDIDNPNQIRLYWVVFCLIKLVKAFSFFTIYNILKGFHSLTFLLILKSICATLLLAFQKPLHGHSPLSRPLLLRILRHAVIRVMLDIFWVTGLVLCGPFRFIIIYEHGDFAMIALLSTIFLKSISSSKSRGVLFFLLAVISIVFFDHDVKDAVSDHPEGVHKSLLIHRIFELFIHLGLSDHKAGVLLLLLAACAEAGFNSAARGLAAAIGGMKRLQALSTCASVGVLLVAVVSAASFGTIFLDTPVSEFSYFSGIWATGLVGLVFVADFYFTDFMTRKVGPNSVQKASYFCLAVTAFVISYYLSGSASGGAPNPESIDGHMPDWPPFLPAHDLSTGAFVSFFAFLYASSLLNRANGENGGGGGRFFNSRRFVGFSAAGLPLYMPQTTPSSSGSGSGDGEGLSFLYHATTTLKAVTADRASFRIFVFLCLNLSFTFIELFYGVWTNSLGLISDGFHMLFDCAALVMGLYASVVGRWKPTRIYSYGFHRAEILSGFINSLALMVISASIFLNALERIQRPPDINTDRLMAVSVGGLLVNLVGMFALGHTHSHGGGGSRGHSHAPHGHGHGHSHGPAKAAEAAGGAVTVVCCSNGLRDAHDACTDHDDHSENSNLRGVYLHVLADTLGSVGVIISSYFVTNYGWNIADPICSLFISGAITYSALPLVKDTLFVLALRAPPAHHPAASKRLLQKVLQVEEVLEVVNPCVWQHTEDSVCASLRLRIASEASEHLVLARVKEALKHDQISYLTVQLEKDEFYQHMEALDLHLDTVARHTRASLTDSFSSANGLHHQHGHSHGEVPQVATRSGQGEAGGWTAIKF